MNTNQDGQQPLVVLLVEDEALVRMTAADVLREDGGFKVVEVVNADEALTVLEATADVRALVTDVEMPGSLDGFTLARVVKQAWPHIGIVVTSGRMAPEPKVLPSGAMFIPKPYRPADLVAAVRTVLPSGQTETPAEAPVPVLPSAIKISQPHTGIGAAGGLAQPLPEPEE
ncbi:response regulator [Microvirga guangxiensis]|uniref:Response regulator receiver domain-containing protein n=1 Tax=Microvirga guangxiensis TaxID=549386 RepID=A0A1G5JXW3_9HYPH|nr:Response regulator receiver domain-containing protein [Microvirga guangxiensis]